MKIEEFIEEIAVTKTFSHPNVLSLIGACLEASSSDKMPLMVVPYMLYGDVKSFLSSKRGNKIDLTELPQVCVCVRACVCVRVCACVCVCIVCVCSSEVCMYSVCVNSVCVYVYIYI